MPMNENDVLKLFLARSTNYDVSSITPRHGRLYNVVMNGEQHIAVLLSHSFEFYEKRYHLAAERVSLVICFDHNTVCPISVLSLRAGNLARPFELPEQVRDIAEQRSTKLGSQVLLGMYISGMRQAQALVNDLPVSTRNRYLHRVKLLNKRLRGRPVGSIKEAV